MAGLTATLHDFDSAEALVSIGVKDLLAELIDDKAIAELESVRAPTVDYNAELIDYFDNLGNSIGHKKLPRKGISEHFRDSSEAFPTRAVFQVLI
jgi:hypothetical protein